MHNSISSEPLEGTMREGLLVPKDSWSRFYTPREHLQIVGYSWCRDSERNFLSWIVAVAIRVFVFVGVNNVLNIFLNHIKRLYQCIRCNLQMVRYCLGMLHFKLLFDELAMHSSKFGECMNASLVHLSINGMNSFLSKHSNQYSFLLQILHPKNNFTIKKTSAITMCCSERFFWLGLSEVY